MYSPFWDKTITIFTPFISIDTIKWYKYVISDVFFKCNSSKSLNDNEYVKDERTIIRIPVNNNYIPCDMWTLSDNKNAFFTVSHESIIVLGNVQDVLEDNSSGSFLFDKYTCSKPINITDNRYIYLPHILISGD